MIRFRLLTVSFSVIVTVSVFALAISRLRVTLGFTVRVSVRISLGFRDRVSFRVSVRVRVRVRVRVMVRVSFRLAT